MMQMSLTARQWTADPPGSQRGQARDVVILGLGNILLRDDGAGIRVIEELRAVLPDDRRISLIDGGTLNFSLLEHLEAADAFILVDAAELDEPAGTIQVFQGDEMDRFLRRGRGGSIHEVGFSQLCDMARLRGTLPKRRWLIAIQPLAIEWGDALSPAVETAVREAAELLKGLTEELVP